MNVRSRHFVVAVALASAILVAALAVVAGDDTARGAPAEAAKAKGDGNSKPPNVVVVMSDDQDVESMSVMPQVRRLIGKQGVTFENSFASNPICCPSRSTFLSGQYAHNTGVLRNSVPNGGFATFDGAETLPVWLQRSGYYTAHIGKYLNGYGASDPRQIPPGWSEWFGSVDPGTYRMYGYTLNENGNLVTYGDYDDPDPATYQTDVYTDKAVDFIERRAPRNSPFYLSVAPLAPHVEVFRRPDDGSDDPPTPDFPNPRPAPRDNGRFGTENLPRGPSFSEADVSDKPEAIRAKPLLSSQAVGQARNRYRSRLASLLAVDDMVKRIVTSLRKSGELKNTVIMYVSDNGFLLGQHRITNGKQFPYEESIRVPLLMRGPGIPKNQSREQLAANVDMAPTILELTGADAEGPIDGQSLVPFIEDERLFEGRAIVLENWCQTDEKVCFDPYDPLTPRYRGVRTDRYAYMRYPNGEQEMYDLERDPDELRSLHASARFQAERAALGNLLDRLQFCRTKACRITPTLKLTLSYKQGALGGGRPCVISEVKARVTGKDAGESGTTQLSVPGGKVLSDDKRPLVVKFKRSQLNQGKKTPIAGVTSLLDGRAVSVRASVPRAC